MEFKMVFQLPVGINFTKCGLGLEQGSPHL